MTLNDGIKALMSSDSVNNALIHESWTDGKYIQIYENFNGKTIKLISTVDGNLKYSEQKFCRKDFASIKGFGWQIISAEGLVRYITNISKKEEEPIPKQQVFSVVNLTDSEKSDVIYKFQKEFDIESLSDGMQTALYKNINRELDKITYYSNKPQSTYDIYNHVLEKVKKSISEEGLTEINRMLSNLGLTRQDLEWVHSIELENRIFVYVDDLDDFDNQAAINLVKKRIHNELEKKK